MPTLVRRNPSVTPATLPAGYSVRLTHSRVDGNEYLHAALLQKGSVAGTMLLQQTTNGLWEVDEVELPRGFGPFVYDLLLEEVFRLGGAGVYPDRSAVSPSARGVWERYYEVRRDVTSTPLPPSVKQHDKYHYASGGPFDFLDRAYSKQSTPFLDALERAGKLERVEERENPRRRRNPDAEPLVFYHGAQRWEGTPSIVAHRKGHAEHGAGIYLTTSWTTASNYAKGGGSVYRFEVAPDVGWLEDARLPVAETVRWVKSLPRLKGKADIVATLERVAGRVGPNIPAETLVAAFVNFDASAGQHGPSLAEYLVAHGIDASHVSRSGEDWAVVFNPAKVLRVTRVPARERGESFAYDLPRVKRKNPRRGVPRRENGLLGSLALAGIAFAGGMYYEQKTGRAKTARAQFGALSRTVLAPREVIASHTATKAVSVPAKARASVTDPKWVREESPDGKGYIHARTMKGTPYEVFERVYGKGSKAIFLEVGDRNERILAPNGEEDGWPSVAAAKKAAEKRAGV